MAHRKVVAWDAEGDALVAHSKGYLVTARTQPGFSHLENFEWFGSVDITQIAPGGGARVVHENSDPPGLTSPVLLWGLNREGDIVAVVPDGTGVLDVQKDPVVLMTEDGEHIARHQNDQ
ncbi:hypothetical protein [Nocardia sp. SC052]|uniref:hypothetical protein n=1 Tax=Nocardia sichangensis TaxID=3385975 RepID=UPI00399F6F26